MVMVSTELYLKKFNWPQSVPIIVKADDVRMFTRDYSMTGEAVPSVGFCRSKFADLPAFGIWADRKESDDELLEELGSGWRGFATEQ